MRRFGIAAIIVLVLLWAGCGGGSNITVQSTSKPVQGSWVTTLTTTSGQPMWNFTMDLNQADMALFGTNMRYQTPSECFGPGSVVTGQVSIENATHTMKVQLKVTYSPPGVQGENELDLSGTMTPNAINGTWLMKGVTAGCNSSGTFTMTKQ